MGRGRRRSRHRSGRFRTVLVGLAAASVAGALLVLTGDGIVAMRTPGDAVAGGPPPGADGRRRVLLLGDSLLVGAMPELSGLLDINDVEARF